MAPNVNRTLNITGVLFEEDKLEDLKVKGCAPENESTSEPEQPFKTEIVWTNVVLMALLHISGVYGGYLFFTSTKLYTILLMIVMYIYGGLGITVGAHRLWTHRAFKAKLPLKIMLMLFNSSAHQNSVIEWARDHRVHHKYTETDADPHNMNRGFFFAHVGWLLCKKHPQVIKCGKGIDISDLTSEPVLAFQHKYYYFIMPLMTFVIPTVVPVYFWGESWKSAWFASTIFRYVLGLNLTWLVNSAAHKFGTRPYDKNLVPTNILAVSMSGFGEGFHNFHHVFPWDYKIEELGNYRFNVGTAFIDLMAKIGWAYDLKTVSPSMVKTRVDRTGDGSHPVWGWGDRDMRKETMQQATTLYKKYE